MPVEVWPQAELARTLSPGKELGRQGGTRPAALRLHPTPQGSAPCHLSQCLSAQDLKITFLKKKKKKSTTPSRTPLPNMYGGTRGAARVGFMETPGTEKEAGLVLGFLVRVPAASAAAIHRRAVRNPSSSERRFSAASSHQPRLRTDGCRQEWAGRWWGRGPRCQRPPPLQRGVSELRGLLWTGPASVCPSLLSCPGRCTLDATLSVCVAVRGCADGGRAGGQQVCPPPGEKRFKMLGPKRRTLPALR